MNTAIDAAVTEVGTQAALAAILGIKSPSISEWRKRGKVPADRCIAIERATNGAVTRYELRPDVFGTKPAEPSREVTNAA